MPEDQTPQNASTEPAAGPASWPEPPPYRPDTDLIGYIEKGQQPPAPTSPPSEDGSRRPPCWAGVANRAWRGQDSLG